MKCCLHYMVTLNDSRYKFKAIFNKRYLKIIIIPQFVCWFSWAKGDDRNESIHHPVPPNFLFVVAIFFPLGATDSTLLLPSAHLGRRNFIEQVGYSMYMRGLWIYMVFCIAATSGLIRIKPAFPAATLRRSSVLNLHVKPRVVFVLGGATIQLLIYIFLLS